MLMLRRSKGRRRGGRGWAGGTSEEGREAALVHVALDRGRPVRVHLRLLAPRSPPSSQAHH
eukprot:1774567-Rhodomonas_salina.1